MVTNSDFLKIDKNKMLKIKNNITIWNKLILIFFLKIFVASFGSMKTWNDPAVIPYSDKGKK